MHEQVGSLVAEDQRNHRAGGPLERCQIGPHVDAIDQEDGEAAEQDRQDEAVDRIENRRARHAIRSEEHTSELQSLMRISYAVFCLKKQKQYTRSQSKRKERDTRR